MPETSIVIRSFNEAEYIEDVLEAVSDQRYQDFEIILVDSGSTDGTLEIAEPYVDRIEFVAPNDFTFGHSCNVGCEVANGRFVSFLSAHAIPTDDEWLQTMVENLRGDESVALTYSNQIGAEQNKFSERRLFNQLFGTRRKRQEPPDYFANNASSVIRRNLWEQYSFDEYLTGHEDIEWAKHFMDQGFTVIYEPDACIYHIHDETEEQVYNRFEREAVADVEIGIKDRSDRWREYAAIPRDIIGDTVAAFLEGEFDIETFLETVRFRYNQHMGTAAGLKSDRDLESNRFEYFYGGANEHIIIDAEGNVELERSPLPEIKPNDVLIRTDFVGVSPNDSRFSREASDGKYPVIPGENYVGTVIDLGANANSVSIGDVVVGETVFDCGICEACSDSLSRDCHDPIRLGIDTGYGPYSRFLAVPSDHVHRLDGTLDPKDGVIARTLARLLDGIERATQLTSESGTCAVVGTDSIAELIAQILQHEGYKVDRVDKALDDGKEYELVADVTGDSTVVHRLVSQINPGSVLLLAAEEYRKFTLTSDDLSGKTIVDVGDSVSTDIEYVLELLPRLELDDLFDGTYQLEEYERAWREASERNCFPVISMSESKSPERPHPKR
jgi:glycosyltransferase involved in cell wall biosynthesis/NADPH:quinone reductase-like Zn-dependent oxidoreductase